MGPSYSAATPSSQSSQASSLYPLVVNLPSSSSASASAFPSASASAFPSASASTYPSARPSSSGIRSSRLNLPPFLPEYETPQYIAPPPEISEYNEPLAALYFI